MSKVPNSESYILGATIGDTVEEQGITYTLTAPAFGMDTWDGGAHGGLIEMGRALSPGYHYKFNGRWFKTFAKAVTSAATYQAAKHDRARAFVAKWESEL